MKSLLVIVAAASGLCLAGCGGRTVTSDTAQVTRALTSATAIFVTSGDGKDADSALTVQLLRNNAELAAELRTTGVKFDDNTTSAPMSLGLAGPFNPSDLDDAQVRIRLTPDGRDDWEFDLRLTLTFADGSSRNFMWTDLELDNETPERTLALSPARVP